MAERPPNPAHASSRPRLEPYSLASPAIKPPALPGKVVAVANVDELIDKLAADLVIHAENCVRSFGDFHLALSGGQTPQPLYERLMYDPNYRRLPWRRTHLWMVDERAVPFDDPASNFGAIGETIVEHADIPLEQVHPMLAMSATGDADYQAQLRETLAWREKGQDRLDYVLLGMGADGHTASLFPHTQPLRETEALVRFNTARNATPAKRLTLTFPPINAARFIGVMVTGESKAATLGRVAEASAKLAAAQRANPAGDEAARVIDELPIVGVRPLHGELRWYLDAAACEL